MKKGFAKKGYTCFIKRKGKKKRWLLYEVRKGYLDGRPRIFTIESNVLKVMEELEKQGYKYCV